MRFDLPTLIAMRQRMRWVRVTPLLFHDARTPQRRLARLERIDRWFGPIGLAVTSGYLSGASIARGIPRDERRFGRHFTTQPETEHRESTHGHVHQ